MNETNKVGRPMFPSKEKRGRLISTRLSPPEPSFPVKDSDFPMKFKECLRRFIGRRSYGDNLPIFKEFHRHYLKSIAIRNGYPAREQTDEYLEQRTLDFIEWFKRDGVKKDMYELYSTEIPAWRKEHRVIPQCRAAANSRWLKENRKKILVILLKRINAIVKMSSNVDGMKRSVSS